MKEIIIQKNENEQRLDRFLQKYLERAPRNFIFKMIRKKNIKVNGKKATPEMIIYAGDRIQLFLSDETIEKFLGTREHIKSHLKLDIVYEDRNIILINKKVGILSHGAGNPNDDNIADGMINYLIEKGDYKPEDNRTFKPSICNRLDRNTSGLIIGAKSYDSLKKINEAIRNRYIRTFYKTIVKGRFKDEVRVEAYLIKDKSNNRVKISQQNKDGAKLIVTNVKPLKYSDGYTLLEIELITGRTHQIRSQLSTLGFPIIGDGKYGDKNVNKRFKDNYGFTSQWLHGYKIELQGLREDLEYLNGKIFETRPSEEYLKIEQDLFI